MHPLLDKSWKDIFPVFFVFNKEKQKKISSKLALDMLGESLRNSVKFT
jgi:hypothetical protein